MGSNTPKLGLYKPGGGSTGLNGSDEVVDIDRINQNFDLIDSYASATDTDVDSLEAKVNRMGPAAASDAARNLLVPSPVAGDAVFRTDKGYTERYYTAYHATNNPGGATPAGWYPEPGADIYAWLQKNNGFQSVSSPAAAVSGLVLAEQSGGFTIQSSKLKVPIAGRYEARVNCYGTGVIQGGVYVGVYSGTVNVLPDYGPVAKQRRAEGTVDHTSYGHGVFTYAKDALIGLAAYSLTGTNVIYGAAAAGYQSTGLYLKYMGPPR